MPLHLNDVPSQSLHFISDQARTEENYGTLDEPAGTTEHFGQMQRLMFRDSNDTETLTRKCEIDHIRTPDPDAVHAFTWFCIETGLTSTWKRINLLNFVLTISFLAELLVQSHFQMFPQGSRTS